MRVQFRGQAQDLVVGSAPPDEHNCLIASITHALLAAGVRVTMEAPAVRKELQATFDDAQAMAFLALERHGPAILQVLCRGQCLASGFTLACIHFRKAGAVPQAVLSGGNVVGSGPKVLYMANECNLHFVLLLPCMPGS